MEGDHIKICYWLKPLSWLYGLVINLRNILFDSGVLPSESFDVPVICVGNITAGGTGKTPHTEYLIRLLSEQHQVAVLSRGYKRKSKGYILATPDTPMQDIGDEPFQMKQKYPQIHMAVDANRRRGIKNLCRPGIEPATDVVLLDDAFQHRYVTPGLNILLMDYHRLPYDDALLPCGLLREPLSSKRRADVVVVTKCPPSIRPIDFRIIQGRLALRPWQRLFFTTIRYGALCPSGRKLSTLTPDTAVLLVTGIANPTPLVDELLRRTSHVTTLAYPDHHAFTAGDLQHIRQAWDAVQAPDRLLITTEKDAARLADALPDMEVLPIEVAFLKDQEKTFNLYIKNHVRKNSSHRNVHP